MEDKDYRLYLKERKEKLILEELRVRGDQFLSFFYGYVNPTSSCAGYIRPIQGKAKISNWRNQPVSWSINVSPNILQFTNEEGDEVHDKSFYVELPLSLLEGDLRSNAWMLAQAWGWMNIRLAIQKIFVYHYGEWFYDWSLFWKKLGRHIEMWGLFPNKDKND